MVSEPWLDTAQVTFYTVGGGTSVQVASGSLTFNSGSWFRTQDLVLTAANGGLGTTSIW